MEFKDYYATLGVDKNASQKDIKQAFRKLARKFHPDVNPGDKSAEARFKEINEANEVLGDPEKRKKYDELGSNWRMYEQAQQAGGRDATGRSMELESGCGGRRRRRFPADDGGRSRGDVRRGRRRRQPVLGFLPHVFRRGRRGRAVRARARGTQPGAAAAEGPRRRARDRARSRGRGAGHAAAPGDQPRRPAAQRRSADPGGGHGRLARPRGGRRRPRQRQRAERRFVPARPAAAACAVRAQRARPLHEGQGTGDHGGARRRGRRADARRQVAAAQDSAEHAERSGVPAARTRVAGGEQARRKGRSLRDGRCAVAATITDEARQHWEALAKAGASRD